MITAIYSPDDNKTKPKYAIVNCCDRPSLRLVAQWIDDVGYCYMAQSFFPELKKYNGMDNPHPTDMKNFGFEIIEASNGVLFRKIEQTKAKYDNGDFREWQDYENSCFVLPYVQIEREP